MPVRSGVRKGTGSEPSLGDLGWIDEESYVFVADRRVDMIISGGVNIFPAEIEAALREHRAVEDVVVVGLNDDEWEERVHALVQLGDSAGGAGKEETIAELDHHCRARLSAVKAPKTYEFVRSLPRNEAGKIRRGQLADERSRGGAERSARR